MNDNTSALPRSYILRELHDVTLPPDIDWYPQTIGWKILAVGTCLVLLYVAYCQVQQWWCNRYRREALDVISSLELNDEATLGQLFFVLKRVLVYLDARDAQLFSTAFLHRLDERYSANPMFHDDVSERWLLSLVDPSVILTNEERIRLFARTKKWLCYHSGVTQEASRDKS
ncbi:MAG: DUF4381 domain-containing protein [Vibrio fluvialis]